MKKGYDSTKIYRKTQKKGASQTYDTPSCADTDKDRVITAKEIYNFVHQGVVEASGNRQHPVMWGKFNETMLVIKW